MSDQGKAGAAPEKPVWDRNFMKSAARTQRAQGALRQLVRELIEIRSVRLATEESKGGRIEPEAVGTAAGTAFSPLYCFLSGDLERDLLYVRRATLGER